MLKEAPGSGPEVEGSAPFLPCPSSCPAIASPLFSPSNCPRMDWLSAVAVAAIAAYAIYRVVRFSTADADLNLLLRGDHRPNAFEGKVVWCTGASQGLGVSIVQHFAAHGAKLILSARNAAQLEVHASLDDGETCMSRCTDGSMGGSGGGGRGSAGSEHTAWA
jgi:hypothetical protein